MKKILSLLLALTTLSFVLVPFTAAASDSGQDGNIEWEFNSSTGVLTISGYGEMTDHRITEYPWFNYRDSIEEVVIEDGVTYVAKEAFNLCNNLYYHYPKLKTVSIGKSVSKICIGTDNEGPFYGEQLESIDVSEDNDYFASVNGVLYNKDKTELINYPSGKKDKSFTVPKTVKKIGAHSFYYTLYLKELIIPDNVTSFGGWATFAGANIESVAIGNGIAETTEFDFSECKKLTDVKLSPGVKTIGKDSFYNCEALKSIDLTYVQNIKEYAFCGCMYLEQVVFGDSLNSIGQDAFSNTKKLTTVFIPKNCANMNSGCGFGFCYSDSEDNRYNGFTFTCIQGTAGARSVENFCQNHWYVSYEYVNENPNYKYLKNAEITGISNKTYTGKNIKPTPIVELNGETLEEDVDYTVSYSNNKNVGEATVTITGIGLCEGSIEKTFNIKPPKTSLSKLTAASNAFTAKWEAKTSGVSGYQLQYATNSSFTKHCSTVKIKGNSTESKKISSLDGNKKYYVRIRTYKTVDGGTYYSSWSSSKTVTTKISASLKLNKSSATIYEGSSLTLEAEASPGSANVKWKTSNKSVATVDSNGKVKGIKKGSATITAYFTYDGKKYSKECKITVKAVSLKLSKTEMTLYNGSPKTLKLSGGDGSVKWKTSNKSVATVDSKGKVTPLKAGSCEISATLGGKTVKCKVTVSKKCNEVRDCLDFGAFIGVKRSKSEKLSNGVIAAYSKSEALKKNSNAIDKYTKEITKKGFDFIRSYPDEDGLYVNMYMKDSMYVITISSDKSNIYIKYIKII